VVITWSEGGLDEHDLDTTTFDAIAYYRRIGRSLAWSPNGRRLAVAGSYGFFVWDLPQ